MKRQSTKIWFPVILLISACQTPAQPTPPASAPEVQATLNSLILTSTSAAANVIPSEPPTPAAQFQATETPSITPTETPTVPPTETLTFTPSVPVVSVTSETNCRTGPSKYYKFIVKIEPGTRYVMTGRHAPSGYWIIRLENGTECWLWGQYALPEGNWASLPEYSQPQLGRIEGTVQKSAVADAQKIAHAFVNIGLNNFQTYETGSDGFFFFEDVPVGEINLTIQHSSFAFTSSRAIVRAGDRTVVTILPLVPLILKTPTPSSSCPPFLPRCQVFNTQLPALP